MSGGAKQQVRLAGQAVRFSAGLGWNAEALGLLPGGWQDQLLSIAQTGQLTTLGGSSSTSLGDLNLRALEVRVVTGDIIKSKLNWLDRLYARPLRLLAAHVTRRRLKTSPLVQSRVNINLLAGRGASYEWHVDSNPTTGLLFATDHDEKSGGELVFRIPSGPEESIQPRAGWFIAFDARTVPHAVMPLITDGVRVSVPMNYYFWGERIVRPPDLDQYLYDSP